MEILTDLRTYCPEFTISLVFELVIYSFFYTIVFFFFFSLEL
jgi:hypothetical protein